MLSSPKVIRKFIPTILCALGARCHRRYIIRWHLVVKKQLLFKEVAHIFGCFEANIFVACKLNCFFTNIGKILLVKCCMQQALKFDMWSWRKRARSGVLNSKTWGSLFYFYQKTWMFKAYNSIWTPRCGLKNCNEAFRKYKTLRLWEHRQVSHSLRFDIEFLLILSFICVFLWTTPSQKNMLHTWNAK